MWFCLGVVTGLWLSLGCLFAAFILGGVTRGPKADSPRAHPSITAKTVRSLLAIATCWLVSLSCSGCSSLGSGPSKALPAAGVNSKSIGDHIASVLGHAGEITSCANKGLALVDDMRAGKLAADVALPEIRQQFVQINTEAMATKVELTAAQEDRAKLDAQLAAAQKEYTAATERADKWEAKYKGQWLAGKSWAVIWSLAIGLGLLLIAAALLNFYTDIFVIPMHLFGVWIAHIVGGTVKALRDLIGGTWSELASLFKKKPTPPPPPIPLTPPNG